MNFLLIGESCSSKFFEIFFFFTFSPFFYYIMFITNNKLSKEAFWDFF